MLNRTIIMGRLTRDPELRRTGSGIAVTSFSIAVDRDIAPQGQEKETDFFDCVAWRNTAEFIAKYFTKGRMIAVDGKLQTRSWTDKDGNKRRTVEIVADNAYFGDSKPQGGSHGSSYGNSATGGSYNAPAPADQNAGYGNNYGGSYGGHPATGSDWAMLDDDDAQLPY